MCTCGAEPSSTARHGRQGSTIGPGPGLCLYLSFGLAGKYCPALDRVQNPLFLLSRLLVVYVLVLVFGTDSGDGHLFVCQAPNLSQNGREMAPV